MPEQMSVHLDRGYDSDLTRNRLCKVAYATWSKRAKKYPDKYPDRQTHPASPPVSLQLHERTIGYMRHVEVSQ
jgi:hypothetical protein